MFQLPFCPTPTEPFGEVIHHYTFTLCTTQKEANLPNSLLQDIAVFNEYDKQNSQAKFAKANSRGLTLTLVIEAINSDKSWGGIKDLLWLTLSNSNIHTYTLHFMDIQQWEKESLAAYIHRFKTEAKRCSFTNDATTTRIFVKGLKNAHSLATCIYEKGPQTLTDAISEVEKLNAAQQLTATIIPPSMVNTASLTEDHCTYSTKLPSY